MTAAIRSWLVNLSLRERWMVGVAGALLACVGGWFVIVRPIQSGLRSSSDALAAAIDRQAGVAQRVADIRNIEARRASTPPTSSGASLDLVLSQSAAEKDLTLGRNEPQGRDATTISIANGRAPVLISWINDLEGSGILATDLSMRPNADGTVSLTATLRRSQ